ncbi:MAG: homoserine dehydrogenase [Candidatus Sulfotelmatobacter sp.]
MDSAAPSNICNCDANLVGFGVAQRFSAAISGQSLEPALAAPRGSGLWVAQRFSAAINGQSLEPALAAAVAAWKGETFQRYLRAEPRNHGIPWKSGASAPRWDRKLIGALAPVETRIHTYNLCFLGFGNVNRTLVELLRNRESELRARHGISYRITGIASRRLGWLANPEGLDAHVAQPPSAAISQKSAQTPSTIPAWLAVAQADVLFEATSLNVQTGQPAIDHIRAALTHGAHAITANKGPIVHAYRELRDLAAAQGKLFLFESTVMDGVPIFSFFDQLPAIHLRGFHGILNSTTNVILTEMENGRTFDEALKKAQSLGIAETDATHDIDGWDAAVKTAALITVLMDVPIKLEDINREGIRNLTAEAVQAAKKAGRPYKLICRAKKTEKGIEPTVHPEQIPLTDPMSQITGTSSYIYFETDIFPGLALTEENPGLYATAYGMLADFVRAVTK